MKGTLPSDSTEKILAVATRDRSAANTSGDVLISTADHLHVRDQQQPQKDARNAESSSTLRGQLQPTAHCPEPRPPLHGPHLPFHLPV